MKWVVSVGIGVGLLFQVGVAGAQQFKLQVDIELGSIVERGAVVFRVESGGDALGTGATGAIRDGTSSTKIVVDHIARPNPGDLVLIHGQIVDGDQRPLMFIPVTAVDFWNSERKSFLQRSVRAVGSRRDALISSFPFNPSFDQSIASHSVSSVLSGLRVILINKWVEADDEWDRVTSDLMRHLPHVLTADSAQAGRALQFLDQFVEVAQDPKFDRFYIEFLLKMKRAGVGGIPIGEKELDDFILASLERVFSTRLDSTFRLSANAILTYREVSPPIRIEECVSLGIVLMNAIEGSIESNKLDVSTGREAAGDVLSFMQKVTECAQQVFVIENAEGNRKDVAAAARHMLSAANGEEFVTSYQQLFVILEGYGHFPRIITGPDSARRLEIVKYYESFYAASRGQY